MGTLRDDLSALAAELIETHISWVFLHDRDVLKVKKPVDLGFVDYSTSELRRRACHDEVRLGSRLAPDVYLGVEPVVLTADGRHRVGGEGTPVDWAVRMRRLEDAQRADLRIEQERFDPAWLPVLAERLAQFHAEAPCDDRVSRHGSVQAVGDTIRSNFDSTRSTIEKYVSPRQAREIEAWQIEFLQTREALFLDRVARGRIRDGHGDLRLEHLYLGDDGTFSIIDCVEFSDKLRCCDVCADVAFLAMDLTWHGRPQWAERFLADYAQAANDYDLYPLVDFYESYRAFVRGKVATILADDTDADPAARERAAGQARRYFLLALASERRQLERGVLVAVGGIIGAGKSTLAQALGRSLAAPVVATDRTRKSMFDAETTDRLSTGSRGVWDGAYSSQTTEEVYDETARRAAAVLDSGRTVIVDASFREAKQRERFAAMAAERSMPFLFVEATAPLDVCRSRLQARRGDVSDAGADLLDEFVARWESDDSLADSARLLVDTTGGLDAAVDDIRGRLAAQG
jgi:aminoglycoside phosphotransferase family enzyme/predicted kinase